MSVDMKKIGLQIATLRRAKGITQTQLGERLNISFQAVSKWERGETLPDTGILVDLATVLETSVDSILTGGEKAVNFKGKITVNDMREGIACLEKCGRLLGKDNLIYRSAVEGINERMNTDVEQAFSDERLFECFVAEAIIQNLKSGAYVDLTDVKNSFKSEHFRNIVLDYAGKYGIK
ncbi:MAG: helix-turn-helix transcriptional regulator [Ruminococcaceae bacterium]|nr:helix-turn-helix transcriptional regulator [Oscillospiraceae bacterium]